MNRLDPHAGWVDADDAADILGLPDGSAPAARYVAVRDGWVVKSEGGETLYYAPDVEASKLARDRAERDLAERSPNA